MYNVSACFQVIPNIDDLLISAKKKKKKKKFWNFSLQDITIIFHGKVTLSPWYIQIFIFQIMSATWVLAHTVVYIFKRLNREPFGHEPWPTNRYSHGKSFFEAKLWIVWSTGS